MHETVDTATTRGLARDNHFVPQFQLNQWSLDGQTVFAHRLLVSHQRVPVWVRRAIKGVAVRRDLYTGLREGREVDDFERWVAADFEAAASVAVEKVTQGVRLGRDDWHALARLFALQDIRTPLSYMEMMQRWQRDMPELMKTTIDESLRVYAELSPAERANMRQTRSAFSESFTVRVERHAAADGPETGAVIRVDATLGRAFWLAAMRHLLSGRAVERLTEHRWSIAEPGDGLEWPLTDMPAVKLNYRSPSEYDFGGGWGRTRTDLFMPLSPRHMLFTEVGRDSGRRIALSASHTRELRRLLIERAHRWVFATEPSTSLHSQRGRVVDRVFFEAEEKMWAAWHEDQMRAEL